MRSIPGFNPGKITAVGITKQFFHGGDLSGINISQINIRIGYKRLQFFKCGRIVLCCHIKHHYCIVLRASAVTAALMKHIRKQFNQLHQGKTLSYIIKGSAFNYTADKTGLIPDLINKRITVLRRRS